MRFALGMGTRIAGVRGCIQRVQELRAVYRRLANDPDADRDATEQARLSWKAWERELGSHADTILDILDYLDRPVEAPKQSEGNSREFLPHLPETPRKPITTAAAPAHKKATEAKKRRAHAG